MDRMTELALASSYVYNRNRVNRVGIPPGWHIAELANGDPAYLSNLRSGPLIELNQQVLAATEQRLPLSAGMQVSAEIVQGRRTVLEYLLSQVQRVVSEAAMER
jgi:hypothetical protein